MTKQKQIDALTKIILDAEKLTSPHTYSPVRVHLRSAITNMGLGKWTGDKIKKWLEDMYEDDLWSVLMRLWNQQTSTERVNGSTLDKDNKGFNGKWNDKEKRWMGDAAFAQRYVNRYKMDGPEFNEWPEDMNDGDFLEEHRLRDLLIKYRIQLARLANIKDFEKKRRMI